MDDGQLLETPRNRFEEERDARPFESLARTSNQAGPAKGCMAIELVGAQGMSIVTMLVTGACGFMSGVKQTTLCPGLPKRLVMQISPVTDAVVVLLPAMPESLPATSIEIGPLRIVNVGRSGSGTGSATYSGAIESTAFVPRTTTDSKDTGAAQPARISVTAKSKTANVGQEERG